MTDSLSAMSREIVLDVAATKNVARVQTRRIAMPAGLPAGLHVHNCPVAGSIVAGSVAFQIEGEPEIILKPGDSFFEPEGVRIARFDALDADVAFVAHYLLAAGEDPGIEFPAG